MLAVSSFLVLALTTTFARENYHVVNDRIIESSTSRECFFHGVNVVYKSFPYLPRTDAFDYNTSFTVEDMELLHSLGHNIIRLGVMWPGVMPEQGQVNETYIKAAEDIIVEANKHNISTLVDCHQDVLTEAVCGEGIPYWAMRPDVWNFPFPDRKAYNTSGSAHHIPSQEDCLSVGWAQYYTAEATSTGFQNLYQNRDLNEAFSDYWGVLAKAFKNTPGIVGFELLNEPWAGDIYNDPSLMWPGNADYKNLAPFYDEIVPAIAGNDSERLVFFESVTWTGEFNASWSKAGFKRAPGGKDRANKSVFSFHYYNPPAGPNGGKQKDYFSRRTISARSWNMTSMVTEFNIGNEQETDKEFEAMSNTMDYCDEHLISWIGWEYKPFAGAVGGTCTGCGYGVFKEAGGDNEAVQRAVSRTYAWRVAGRTKRMKFDWALGGNFTLEYEMNAYITKPTEIYLARKYWYPEGYDVHIEPAAAVKYREEGNVLEVFNEDKSYDGKLITVQINPKQ